MKRKNWDFIASVDLAKVRRELKKRGVEVTDRQIGNLTSTLNDRIENAFVKTAEETLILAGIYRYKHKLKV